MYKLTTDKLQSYLLGGKADFIVKEKDNENHINFQVRKDSKKENLFYVTYHGMRWDYIGLIKKENDMIDFYPIKLDTKYTQAQIEKSKIFRKLFLFIFALDKLPSNIEVMYSGRCSVCNRLLTDPIYIEIGIGKICLENGQ